MDMINPAMTRKRTNKAFQINFPLILYILYIVTQLAHKSKSFFLCFAIKIIFAEILPGS